MIGKCFDKVQQHEMNSSLQPRSEATSICVVIRARPLNEKEIREGHKEAFKTDPKQNLIIQHGDDRRRSLTNTNDHYNRTFGYEKIFDATSRSSELYAYLGQDAIQKFVNGVNASIFGCKSL